jgi:hypothetical protein
LPLVGVTVIGLKGSDSEVADKSIWKYNNCCKWVENDMVVIEGYEWMEIFIIKDLRLE